MDYVLDPLQLRFIVDLEPRVCTTITATDDSILENSENISLVIDTDAMHSSQPATITITDNDSMLCDSAFILY